MNITPAILPHSYEELEEKLTRIEGLAERVQIDLCDGVFGREKTWLPNEAVTLRGGISYEFDIMVHDWRGITQHALQSGATAIVSHVDLFSDDDLKELVAMISGKGIMLYVAVSNDKSIDFHADKVRFVQKLYPNVSIEVMGIKSVGEQGQFFDDATPARVRELRQQFPRICMQVDGGMSPDTLRLVKEAGADAIVVGSFIFGHHDAREAMRLLSEAVGEY